MQISKEKEFSNLIQQHRGVVYKVLGQYLENDIETQDDLFQDICIRAWQAYDSFRGESKFST